MLKRTRVPALFALLPLVVACGHGEEVAVEDVRPVRSIAVGLQPGSVSATYSGEVHARHETRHSFQTSGRITARQVEVGSRVRRGQVLARLDPAQEVLHVVSAAASVEAVRNRVAQNRVDLERTRQLHERQFASRAELDQQQLALAEAESQLKSALAQQQIKVNQRGYTDLVADRDGVISAVHAEAGQVVSPGQAVVTLAADGEREVLVSIPEQRIDELRRARALRVSLWASPGKTYRGVLRELAPDADSVTRTYSARISIADADSAVLLGMTASVLAPDIEGSTGIRLPLAAIYNKSGAPLVWVIDAKTSQVSTRPVRLGAAHNDQVVVAEGLAAGEQVVTAGVHLLHPGQKVKVIGAPVAALEVKP
jgi:RND family efflux transporter MFP subunit